MNKIKDEKHWEVIASAQYLQDTRTHWPVYRLEVPGGWLYKQSNDTLEFVPAPDWNEESQRRQNVHDQAIEDRIRAEYDFTSRSRGEGK